MVYRVFMLKDFLSTEKKRHKVELFRKELHAVWNIANEFIPTFTQPQLVGSLRSFGDDTPCKLNDEALKCCLREGGSFRAIVQESSSPQTTVHLRQRLIGHFFDLFMIIYQKRKKKWDHQTIPDL